VARHHALPCQEHARTQQGCSGGGGRTEPPEAVPSWTLDRRLELELELEELLLPPPCDACCMLVWVVFSALSS
jgi:hypothetical protein